MVEQASAGSTLAGNTGKQVDTGQVRGKGVRSPWLCSLCSSSGCNKVPGGKNWASSPQVLIVVLGHLEYLGHGPARSLTGLPPDGTDNLMLRPADDVESVFSVLTFLV